MRVHLVAAGCVVLFGLVGCVPPGYRVQRAVRAPHATTPLHTGQPLAGVMELTAGATSAANAAAPRRGSAEHAVEIPDQQVRGELRVRVAQRGEVALIHERGIGATARAMDETQAPVEDGDPHGTGAAVRVSAVANEQWSIGFELELLHWSLPYVEYRTCVENCGGTSYTMVEHGIANVGTLGLGLTPSYKQGKWTLFGGAFARNHPTVQRKGMEYGYIDAEDEVDRGPLNVLLHAGAAYQLHRQITAILKVDQNLTTVPVQYGPTIAFALSAALDAE